MTKDEIIATYIEFLPKNLNWMITKLDDLNFFDYPASTKYHGCYKGGLAEHSLQVARELDNLTDKLSLTWDREESPYLVGILHDLCKVDSYVLLPDAENGKWEYRNDIVLPGHGEKSVILAQRIINLTEEEILCIRWHMGAYETDTKLWNYYGRAIEKYPNVLYTHTADMIASKIKNL